jgi:hypothetical protein
LLNFIERSSTAQADGLYLESIRPAEKVLNQLKKAGASEIPDRLSLVGTLHSLVGNAYCETDNLANASKHHQHDFLIAEQRLVLTLHAVNCALYYLQE